MPNTVFMTDDKSADNNDACIPLLPPGMASLTINKVGIDDRTTPLPGAQFALYPATADGTFDPNATPVARPVGDAPRWENLAPGKYYVVEAKAPDEYQPFWYALALAVGMGMVLLNLGLFRREQ